MITCGGVFPFDFFPPTKYNVKLAR